MTNPSRNTLCPCGSGKRYKHCCGATSASESNATTQGIGRLRLVLADALELQRAGRNEEAATFYEAILETEPDNPDAHNMLVVIRAEQWRMVEALRHAHKAGELTNWSHPDYYHNYALLIELALGNAEATNFKQTRTRYLETLETPPMRPAVTPTISILFFEQATFDELKQSLKRLAEQVLQPYEVLIPAGLADSSMLASWPFPVRSVSLQAGSEAFRKNLLADAAQGNFILALGKDDTLLPEHLSRLARTAGTSNRWVFAQNLQPQTDEVVAEDEMPTIGFSLLSRADRVVTESNLLVPRELNQRVGGYDPESPAPSLDYCLRLLWEMEPLAITNETCLPAVRPEDNEARLATIGDYLDKALSNTPSPNAYAPSRQNWGLRLHLQIARQKLFVSVPFMTAVNNEVEDYLLQKQARSILPEPGVNLIGLARGELGLGENMRAFARASMEGNIPCAIRDFIFSGTRRRETSLEEHLAEYACHNCSIIFVNPDFRQLYSQQLDAVVFERPSVDFRHLKIGYWFWELEKIPAQWQYAFAKVDEIWVATDFIATAMRHATDKPVIKIPTPIAFEIKGQYGRSYFGLPSNTFIFLFSFDFNSFPERKNPHAVIRAFQRAFPRSRQDVTLVIKSVNASRKPQAMQALLEQTGGDPRILLINEFMTRDEVYGLQSVVDAYVSLHRAEGLGLGLAECMCQGKPVIGTAYSGNMEFMNESNSCPVGYSMAPVRKGDYLYDDPGYFWAEPDEEHAAYFMAKLVDDVDFRCRIAIQGREDIRRKFNYTVVAEQMKGRLRKIGVL